MRFDEVLHDMANQLIEEANAQFLIQHRSHDFKAFSCERGTITSGGSHFKIRIEFDPDPVEAHARRVARN